MKKTVLVIIASILLVASVAVATPIGILYTDVKEPVSANAISSSSKTASGTNFSILGLIGLGDSCPEKIAAAAGITKIQHIDKRTIVFPFGIYISETFTVSGD